MDTGTSAAFIMYRGNWLNQKTITINPNNPVQSQLFEVFIRIFLRLAEYLI
jgi:hypothetical protein